MLKYKGLSRTAEPVQSIRYFKVRRTDVRGIVVWLYMIEGCLKPGCYRGNCACDIRHAFFIMIALPQ